MWCVGLILKLQRHRIQCLNSLIWKSNVSSFGSNVTYLTNVTFILSIALPKWKSNFFQDTVFLMQMKHLWMITEILETQLSLYRSVIKYHKVLLPKIIVLKTIPIINQNTYVVILYYHREINTKWFLNIKSNC